MQEWFAAPIRAVLAAKGPQNQIIGIDPTGFFSLTVQFSLVSALIITAPLLFWQVWLFIEPALTNSERRYSLIVVPFSSALFFMGAALSYLVSPLFFKFFLAFQPDGVAANWDYGQSVVLMAKMLLAFGIMFQVPVIVIFLNKLGLLSRNVLIDYWRHAVIAIFTLAAIVTPTWDPVTLAVCAVPPCLLYMLSIWLVKWL
jgi:sec-independent protein translocase protein TatC